MKEEKINYVRDLANSLAQFNVDITVAQFRDGLNQSGILTEYDTEYEGKRGTYRLLSCVWKVLTDQGDNESAKNVAERILTNDREAPWL